MYLQQCRTPHSDCPALQVEACLNLPEGHQPGAVSALALAEDVYGPFSGQVTSAARQAFRRAILEAGPRLVEAMFLCEIATASEALSGGHLSVCFRLGQGPAAGQTACLLTCWGRGWLQSRLPVCRHAAVSTVCKAGCRTCGLAHGQVDLSASCKTTAGPGGLSAGACAGVLALLVGPTCCTHHALQLGRATGIPVLGQWL